MARPRRTRRTLVIVAVLVLVSVTLITFDERGGTHHLTSGLRSLAHDVFSPITSGINAILAPIGDFFAGSVHYGALQSENQRLQAEIGSLRLQQREIQAQAKQQRQLRALTRLPFLPDLKTVTAPMINFNLSNFDADITIGKGSADGVADGMPVVGAGGLVGQVVATSLRTATVQLITDSRSSVGVAFGPGNQTYGEANGEGAGNLLSVAYVPSGTPIHIGETMYTNGLAGESFPANIPVGQVYAFHSGVGIGSMSISLTPSADLSQLAYVDVILWEPPL